MHCSPAGRSRTTLCCHHPQAGVPFACRTNPLEVPRCVRAVAQRVRAAGAAAMVRWLLILVSRLRGLAAGCPGRRRSTCAVRQRHEVPGAGVDPPIGTHGKLRRLGSEQRRLIRVHLGAREHNDEDRDGAAQHENRHRYEELGAAEAVRQGREARALGPDGV
jgi:hypothetical protein